MSGAPGGGRKRRRCAQHTEDAPAAGGEHGDGARVGGEPKPKQGATHRPRKPAGLEPKHSALPYAQRSAPQRGCRGVRPPTLRMCPGSPAATGVSAAALTGRAARECSGAGGTPRSPLGGGWSRARSQSVAAARCDALRGAKKWRCARQPSAAEARAQRVPLSSSFSLAEKAGHGGTGKWLRAPHVEKKLCMFSEKTTSRAVISE